MKKQLPEIPQSKLLMRVNTNTLRFLVGLGILDYDKKTDDFKLSERIAGLNMAICKDCNTFLHSEYVHDWVPCNCELEKQCYVDGGDQYHRRGAADWNQMLYPGNKRPIEAK